MSDLLLWLWLTRSVRCIEKKGRQKKEKTFSLFYSLFSIFCSSQSLPDLQKKTRTKTCHLPHQKLRFTAPPKSDLVNIHRTFISSSPHSPDHFLHHICANSKTKELKTIQPIQTDVFPTSSLLINLYSKRERLRQSFIPSATLLIHQSGASAALLFQHLQIGGGSLSTILLHSTSPGD